MNESGVVMWLRAGADHDLDTRPHFEPALLHTLMEANICVQQCCLLFPHATHYRDFSSLQTSILRFELRCEMPEAIAIIVTWFVAESPCTLESWLGSVQLGEPQ